MSFNPYMSRILGGEELSGDEVVVVDGVLPETQEEVIELVAEQQAEESDREIEDAGDELEAVAEAVEEVTEAQEEAIEIVEVLDGDPVAGTEGLLNGTYNGLAAKYTFKRMQSVARKLGVDMSRHCSLNGTENFDDVYAIKHDLIAGREGLIGGIQNAARKVWEMIKRIFASIRNFFVRIFSGKKDLATFASTLVKKYNNYEVKRDGTIGSWAKMYDPERPSKDFADWCKVGVITEKFLEDMADKSRAALADLASKGPDSTLVSPETFNDLKNKLTSFISSLKGVGKQSRNTEKDSYACTIAETALAVSTRANSSGQIVSVNFSTYQDDSNYRSRSIGERFTPSDKSMSDIINNLKVIIKYSNGAKLEQISREFDDRSFNTAQAKIMASLKARSDGEEYTTQGAVIQAFNNLKMNYAIISKAIGTLLPIFNRAMMEYCRYTQSVTVDSDRVSSRDRAARTNP